MSPDVTAADLAHIPLTEKDRANLASTLSQANSTPEGCANLKLAKGPWQSNQTRMYAVFGASSKTAVFSGVMESGKSKIKIHDARVSFSNGFGACDRHHEPPRDRAGLRAGRLACKEPAQAPEEHVVPRAHVHRRVVAVVLGNGAGKETPRKRLPRRRSLQKVW